MITLDQFKGKYNGQSLLYAPSPAREYLRGQCVQLVCYYVVECVESPVMWADAANWWRNFNLGQWFDKVPASSGPPKRGDIVIWDEDLAGSGGAGHIDVADSDGDANGFWGFDQNWGGKYAHRVYHNYSHVLGYLRPKNNSVIVGDDMITREQYLVGGQAVGTVYGKDFNYDPNISNDQFVQFLLGQSPKITKEMEHALADEITGVKGVIGDGYNSQFVGKQVVTDYPKMVDFWVAQRNGMKPPTLNKSTVIDYIAKNLPA